MEIRRSTSSSWDGADIWRAREDHTLVALGSKVKLEERGERGQFDYNQKEPVQGIWSLGGGMYKRGCGARATFSSRPIWTAKRLGFMEGEESRSGEERATA